MNLFKCVLLYSEAFLPKNKRDIVYNVLNIQPSHDLHIGGDNVTNCIYFGLKREGTGSVGKHWLPGDMEVVPPKGLVINYGEGGGYKMGKSRVQTLLRPPTLKTG